MNNPINRGSIGGSGALPNHALEIADVNGLADALATIPDGGSLADALSGILARLSTISNFASPNAGPVDAGEYYDNSFQAAASTTLNGTANTIILSPFYTSVSLPIDRIGVAISTAVVGNQIKLVIYGATPEGRPDELLYESAAIDAAVVGYLFASSPFTFDRGRQYWIGYRSSSTGQIRAINVSSGVNLGITSTGTSYFTVLRRILPFVDPAPVAWNYLKSDRISNIPPPSIRMRAA